MLYLAVFTVLILGLKSDTPITGIISDGCDPSDDPCVECYTCSPHGRCVPMAGCIPSDSQMPEDPESSENESALPQEPESPEIPQYPEAPEVPELPPSTPEIPEVPEEPVDSEVPEVPEAPSTPELPEDPQVPDAPSTPEIPEVPEVPEAPESPESPESPATPEVPAVPEEPSTPETPETPQVPEAPSAPQEPESPAFPQEPADNDNEFDVGFGNVPKGEGSAGISNPMGECQYDGSLGAFTNDGAAQYYHAECTRLSMAECMTSGPSGRCVYVPAEGSAIGCIWDGTGCEVGCIPANMEQRCGALSHDMESCEGPEGLELRCKWSKAGADSMPGFGSEFDWPRDSSAEGAVDGDDEGADGTEGADDSEGQSFPYPPMNDGDAPFEYPPMDQGADSAGYPPMDQGSDSMGYPQMDPDAPYGYPPMDQGSESVDIPYGVDSADAMAIPDESSMFDKVRLFNMESKLSSRDLVLVVLVTVTALIGLYQLYRWCVNWKLYREYKLVNTSDRAARPSHCIIDGQAYF